MKGNDFETAPRDGTVILIQDFNDEVCHSTAVRFYNYSDDDEMDEEGFWMYADDAISGIAPDGPTVPFRWLPDPFAEASK